MAGEGQRGPRRSEAARDAILSAAASLVMERGYERLTMEGIAVSAGVSKATIYRWWRSKSELITDCLAGGYLMPGLVTPKDSGDLRADLLEWIEGIVDFYLTPGNESLLGSLIGAAVVNHEVAVALSDRLGVTQALVGRFATAMERGELPVGTSTQTLIDALLGALVLRDLRHGLDTTFPRQIVDLLLPVPDQDGCQAPAIAAPGSITERR